MKGLSTNQGIYGTFPMKMYDDSSAFYEFLENSFQIFTPEMRRLFKGLSANQGIYSAFLGKYTVI